jgi:hypothetical protein
VHRSFRLQANFRFHADLRFPAGLRFLTGFRFQTGQGSRPDLSMIPVLAAPEPKLDPMDWLEVLDSRPAGE